MDHRGDAAARHVPVLRDRIVDLLEPALQTPGAVCVDGTLGMGGHAEAILERCPQARLIGLDRDEEALALSAQRLARFGDRYVGVHAVYDDIATVLAEQAEGTARGILFDLGVSSLQLDEPERGFAYRHDAPLDMRMDQSTGITAADVLNTYSHGDLARILRTYGEERFAGRIASAIVREREKEPFTGSARLVEVLRGAVPAASQRTGGHPAKRTFQALRIEVNAELEVWERAVTSAIEVLAPGGRIAVLSLPLARGPHHQAGPRGRCAQPQPARDAGRAARARRLPAPAHPWGRGARRARAAHQPPVRLGPPARCRTPRSTERRPRMSQLAPVRPLPRTSPRRAATTPRPLKVVAPPELHGNGLFLALCVALLLGGFVGVLMLNTAMAKGSYTMRDLQRRSDQLADTQDALRHTIDGVSGPGPLAQRARALGMVPAATPAFLRLSDGKVLGVAKKAKEDSTFSVVTEAEPPTRKAPVTTPTAPAAGTPSVAPTTKATTTTSAKTKTKTKPTGTTKAPTADPAPAD